MNAVPFISILTLLPLVGAMVVVGLGPEQKKLARGLSLGFSFGALALVLVLVLWGQFNSASGELQLEEGR